MVEVAFIYNQMNFVIQANLNDLFKDIINKFIQKSLIESKTVFFICNGKTINPEKAVESYMNSIDKKYNKMTILVNISEEQNLSEEQNPSKENVIIQSKDIICPKCNEPCRITIDNYKIKFFDCINCHIINNIKIVDFKKTQQINISHIICHKCKSKNKGNSYNYEFFRCLTCNNNLCILCRSNHNINHDIIKYDQKNYICPKHNDHFNRYCHQCHLNICFSCEEKHSKHNTKLLSDLKPDIEKAKKRLIEIKNEIEKLNNQIKDDKLNKVLEAMKEYYEINNDIINNFEIKNRNYQSLQNMKEIYTNNIIIENLKKINNNNNINDKLINIIELYNNIYSNNNNEINPIDNDYLQNSSCSDNSEEDIKEEYIGKRDSKGLKQGFGIHKMRNGSRFRGIFTNDKVTGWGIYDVDGDIYKGEFKNDRICGYGEYSHGNDAVYYGYWKNDIQFGIGYEIWGDSSQYSGEYNNGKKDGIGTYIWQDKKIYMGEWKENNMEGFGINKYADGKQYSGEWKNNKMNGYGEFIWVDGRKYVGFYKDDKKEGFGIFYWPDNKFFIGFWKDGKQNGFGKYIKGDECKYGIWKEGKREKWIDNVDDFINKLNPEHEVYQVITTYNKEKLKILMDIEEINESGSKSGKKVKIK